MKDPYFLENNLLICEEGKKIQAFHQRITRKCKKVIEQILKGNISKGDISFEERLILEKIEKCIYKIENIIIRKEAEIK
jgi:hypothetical protein